MVITPELADEIYTVLVEHAGATDDESNRLQFQVFCKRHTGPYQPGEYRFGGSLGFGGKFWLASEWSVSCYREDETPERWAAMDATNVALADLRAKVRA